MSTLISYYRPLASAPKTDKLLLLRSFPSLSVGFILQDILHLFHPPHTQLECLGIAASRKPEVGHSIFGERLACKVSGKCCYVDFDAGFC